MPQEGVDILNAAAREIRFSMPGEFAPQVKRYSVMFRDEGLNAKFVDVDAVDVPSAIEKARELSGHTGVVIDCSFDPERNSDDSIESSYPVSEKELRDTWAQFAAAACGEFGAAWAASAADDLLVEFKKRFV